MSDDQDKPSDYLPQLITKTSIHHSEQESEFNRQLYETLEMSRLGLPTQFRSNKMKRKTKKRKIRVLKKSDFQTSIVPLPVDNFEDEIIKNNPSIMKNEFTEPESIDHGIYVETENQIMEYCDNQTNDSKKSDDILEIVEEFPSIKLSNNSNDNYDNLPVNCSFKDEKCMEVKLTVDEDDIDDMVYDLASEPKSISKKKKRMKTKNKLHIYWRQRFVLFSRFNDGIKMDKESWYSVTPESIASHIAERVQNVLAKRYPSRVNAGFIVMDPFCGAGGNVIQFALQPQIQKVYAIDIDPKKIEMAKHNARIYECADKIEFLIGDYFEMVSQHRFGELIDVCSFSPPWGGPEYIKCKLFSLNQMKPNGFEICRHISRYLTKNIVMLVPRNFDEQELQNLSKIVYNENNSDQSQQSTRMVELEKNMIFSKVKTKTIYFGDTIDFELSPVSDKKVFFE